jgi:hypothetical protein
MFLSDYLMESKPVGVSPSRDTRHQSRGVATVGMDGSVTRSSTAGDENSTFSDDKSAFSSPKSEEKFEMILEDDSNRKRRKRTICTVLIAAVLASLFFVIVFFTTQHVQEKKAATAINSDCFLGVKETREPQLEIFFTGLSREPTDEETNQLKAAVMKGYNEVAGGCDDEYQRWMYQADLVSATVHNDIIMDENTSSLHNLFEDVSAFVARFDTKISCDGCPEDEVFASVYPPMFGAATVGPSNRRRASDQLNAAEIVLAIEREVRYTMPNFDSFLEFSILTQRDDGSAISTSLMRESGHGEPNDEFYNPSFFRQKAIQETQESRECGMDGKKKRAKSRKNDSGSSSKSNKSSDSSTKSSKNSKGDNGRFSAKVSATEGCECECMCDMERERCECDCDCESSGSGGSGNDSDSDSGNGKDPKNGGKDPKNGDNSKQPKAEGENGKQPKAEGENGKQPKAEGENGKQPKAEGGNGKQPKAEGEDDAKKDEKCEEDEDEPPARGEEPEPKDDGKKENNKRQRKKVRRNF